jgi:hypothetical protein
MAFNRCDIPDGRVYMVQEVTPPAPSAGSTAASEAAGTSSSEATAASVGARVASHCMYNANHINYKMSFAELMQEQLYDRFPRVAGAEGRAASASPGKPPPHPGSNNYLSRGDDAYSHANYWKMPIPIMD